jgi:O-antigen/teichoic acid export membrane protein
MPLSTNLDKEKGDAASFSPRKSCVLFIGGDSTWRSTARRIVSVAVSPSARKSFAAIFDQAVVSGTGFATSVIIGRLCSQEDLGIYALGLSLVRFILGVQIELVCSPYLVHGNHRKGEALAVYTGSTLVHHLLLSALSLVGLLGLLGLVALGIGPAHLAPVVWGLIGVLPFLALREYLRQVSLCHLRLATVLAIDLTVAALQLGGLLLLGYLGVLTVSGAYVVAGAACAAACLGWFLMGRQPLRFVWRQLGADWRQNWTFSRWTLAGFLIGTTTPYFMPWILALAHGEAATGVLAACSTLINAVSMYVTGMANVLTPRAVAAFVRGGVEDLQRVLRKTAMLFAVTVGGFCLFVFATGDLPARLVYGDRYAGCGSVLALLAVAALANSLGITAGNGLWAVGRPRANFAADVCAMVVTWAVLLCAVGPLGVSGAALALAAGSVSGAVVRGLTLRRVLTASKGGGSWVEGGV